jgi:hypothetical protein
LAVAKAEVARHVGVNKSIIAKVVAGWKEGGLQEK